MREIVHMQVGQCGNQIGSSFWNLISEEHGLNSKGYVQGSASCRELERIHVYYNEGRLGNFTPRALMIDMETLSLYACKDSLLFHELLKAENIIYGRNSPGNNWAKGHFTEGQELLGPILDGVRRECELTENLQGFQLVHSVGGGTGSGLGTLILSKLREEYPGTLTSTFSVVPSPKVSETVVEPYNAILSFNELIQFSDETFCVDNEALYEICRKTLALSPDFVNLNELVSVMMSGVTTSLRFSCQPRADLRKIIANIIPYPKFHFLMPGYAPLSAKNVQRFTNFTMPELIQQLFDARNMMTACDPKNGKYFSANAIFRGRIPMKKIDDQIINIRDRNQEYFISWVANNLGATLCDVAPRGLNMSVTFIGNSTTIRGIFHRISAQCSAMLKKKAFLHWYTGEGLDVEEIETAMNNVNDLVSEYQEYQDMPCEDDCGDIDYEGDGC